MSSSVLSAQIDGKLRNNHKSGLPIKCFRGKCFKSHCFEVSISWFCTVLALVLVSESLFLAFSEKVPMVSIPLGFEIPCYEKKNWVSENGVFAFGFFNQRDGYGFVVGIWYNLGENGVEAPVWTVGAGVRVSENSTFKLSMDGSFVLIDNPTGLVIWTSNTSGLRVESASLLDDGNLVLTDLEKKIVWESFCSPTDTLLPGQSLHFPQTLEALSENSIASSYSFVIRGSGDIELVWKNNVSYWSSHLQSSVIAREVRFDSNGVLELVDDGGGIVWSKLSEDYSDVSVSFRRLRMEADGNLRIYSWNQVLQTWRVGWQAVGRQCDVFGSCGLYSLCGYNSTGPICSCLLDYPTNLGTGLAMDFGNGCKKMADLSNCRFGKSMLVLKRTVLYGLYPPHNVDTILSAGACKKSCLRDDSCFAATSKNDGSGVCTITRTSFITGYQHSSLAATSFLKECLIPQAVSAREADSHNPLKPPLQQQRSLSRVDHDNGFVISIALPLLLTVCVFLAVQMLVFWFLYRRRQTKAQWRNSFRKNVQMDPRYSVLIRLTFEELKNLTNNFGDPLSLTVFKGILPNQMPVIVKVLDDTAISERDFRMAVSILGRTHHRNLVPLKGFCFEPKHKLLLYEYIANGSLDDWLFGNDGVPSQQRLEIAVGIARAVAYLHLECQQCIAHGNLKLKNVLLDSELIPKVSDFGLRSLLQREESSSSETLPERDIYMFGEMLLRIITGDRSSSEGILFSSVTEMYRNGELSRIVDVRMKEKVEWEGVGRAIRIGLWCMQDEPVRRPSIGEVVKVLEGAFLVDTPPRHAPNTVEENRSSEEDFDAIEEILS